jgi:hypothetical protein
MYVSADTHRSTVETAPVVAVLPCWQDLVAKRRNGVDALAGRRAS